MIEIDDESKRGYFYGELREHDLALVQGKIERVESICGVKVTTFEIEGYKAPQLHFDLLSLGELRCRHDSRIRYSTINRLPQEGWCEMIDCWSCHDHEFNSLLDLKIKPRVGGLLTSNFYLIAHPEDMPACCKGESKIYYNDLKMAWNDTCLIYKFFDEYFDSKNSIVLARGSAVYEIRFFYRCSICIDEPHCAIKVGIRQTDKECDDSGYIGGYFVEKIVDHILGNMLSIKLLLYNISFIIAN